MAPKISDILDDAAYVGTAVAGYTGFVAANPTVAFYIGLIDAALFALSNRLAAQGY
jgi:hypothetical protein